MAKHVIAESYTFTPSTKTITLNNKFARQEQLLLITNVTRGTVLYNFSDPALGATSYTNSANVTTGSPTTTVVLSYNTGGHSSSDKLSILVEETNESFQPSQELTDPVNKLRTSQPQALIDTDFEYGQQATKWETLSLLNNRPFAYYDVTRPLTIANIWSSGANTRVYIANTFPTVPPAIGSPIYIQDTTFSGADGLYVVDANNIVSNTVTYTGKLAYTLPDTGNIFTQSVTVGFLGSLFSNAAIIVANTTFAGNAITVTTTQPHGLLIGNEIAFVLSSGTNAPNGSWYVSTVSNNTVFSFYANAAPGSAITGGNLYCRPTGQSNHRAFDGGVVFSTNSQSHNQQIIRQTRRYFRYQSGKGVQISTGSILKPNFNTDRISSSGTTVTVVTKTQHNLLPGANITVVNAVETGYNGIFVINTVIDSYKFTYTALSTPSANVASGQYIISATGWYGGASRIGMFDNQNGIFFEFDGSVIYAVRRSSTYQLSGFVSVSPGSEYVTGVTINGVSPVFSRQLIPGDFIVIKGMSYKVDSILSDNQITILPSYRGAVAVTNAVVSKTIDTRVPQSQWNLDKMDGTGSSGTELNLSKMQMFYMDYSWYGAGFIRWGFRGQGGDLVYCHKMMNNNVNTEAYMRSGNLPARYDVSTYPDTTYLTGTVLSTDVISIPVASTFGFSPGPGTALIRNANAYEYFNYTGITDTSLTGLTRGLGGNIAAVGALTVNNPIITITNTSGIQVGQYVFGPYLPYGAFVANLVANTSVTLTSAPYATVAASPISFAPMALTAQTWIYSSVSPTAVEYHGPNFSPSLSHWGTSVIMDGRFDDDKSFVFTNGTASGVSINPGARQALQSYRIAPSVSNGVPGNGLGIREIVNRMQMVLRQIDLFANGSVLVNVVLNTTVSSSTPNWAAVGGSSLVQYVNHSTGTNVSGGEVIYGFYLNTTGVATQFNTTQQDLVLVRDLGTSIMSGGNAGVPNLNVYPDGPDVVTIVATNIGPVTSNMNCRLSWTEAQA